VLLEVVPGVRAKVAVRTLEHQAHVPGLPWKKKNEEEAKIIICTAVNPELAVLFHWGDLKSRPQCIDRVKPDLRRKRRNFTRTTH
jgi:hypothetical protein